MKRFIVILAALVVLAILGDFAYYRLGWYVDLRPQQPPSSFAEVEGNRIYITRSGRREAFEMRGINMGPGLPGKWATDFAIDKETYLRWFARIQEMGANTLRIYTIHASAFYEAFYEYNTGREEPLYLLQGVWVNDYILNSHRDA